MALDLASRLAEHAEKWLRNRATERAFALDEKKTLKKDSKKDSKTRRKNSLSELQEAWRKEYMTDKHWLADGWREGAEEEVANWFGGMVSKDVSRQWNTQTKRMGMPEFKVPLTRTQTATIKKCVKENVALIRKMSGDQRERIEKMVMQDLKSGINLKSLRENLIKQTGMAERRARLIARDQTNKATSQLFTERSLKAGAKTGIWMHSLARMNPRKSHLEASQKELEFDLQKGAWLKDDSTGKFKYQWPGREINCGCTYRPVFYIGTERFD